MEKKEEKKEAPEEEKGGEGRQSRNPIAPPGESIGKKQLPAQPSKPSGTLAIPLVTLGKPPVETGNIKIDTRIPDIRRGEKLIGVPFLKLQKAPSIAITQKLNYNIMSTEQRPASPAVPLFKPGALPTVRITHEFNADVAKIGEERAEPWVPSYRAERFSSQRPQMKPNSTLPTTAEAPKSRAETREAVAESAEAPSGTEEELPDFLEFAFGGEGRKIREKGPKIILFQDIKGNSYINFLQQICLRLYREIEGGRPRAVTFKNLYDLNKEEIEKSLKADGKILTVDLDAIKANNEKEFSELIKGSDVRLWQSWWERLEETYSSNLGFIIFTTRERDTFDGMISRLDAINWKSQGRLNIVYLEARSLPTGLIKLSSGMIDPPEKKLEALVVEGEPTLTFDYIFNQTLFNEHSLFNRALEEIKEEENGLFKLATARSEGEEDDLHYSIKVFIVRYLAHRLRERGIPLRTRKDVEDVIKTEIPKDDEGIPDVQTDGEFYEVETLFGEGTDADKKIDKTIKKYTDERVNIVMDNFGFLLHLKDLKSRKSDKSYKNVEFYTLDLKNKKLISIEEFEKELRGLEKPVPDSSPQ